MDLNQLESSDQRKVALHECAHALVARHYGVSASLTIWRNIGGDPITERTWLGRVYLHGRFQTPRRSRRVAIAGNLAELMADSSREEFMLEDHMMDSFWCEDGWSATDCALADGWTSADFRAVHSLLKRKWKALLREVDVLISQAAEADFASS